MCHRNRSRSRTDEQAPSKAEEPENSRERDESPAKGIIDAPVRALKRAYAMVA